jgi:hypothetical protein
LLDAEGGEWELYEGGEPEKNKDKNNERRGTVSSNDTLLLQP